MAGAAVSILPGSVLGAEGKPAANDRINHAVIGCGGMGNGHIGIILADPQAKLVAVCDVDAKRLAAAQARGGPDCKAYRDFREMLASEAIDCCHVVTPPHWHALQNVAALDAGCDVWAEKPMTRTIDEGQAVIDAVRRNGRVFRLNTWFRLQNTFYGLGTTVKPLKKLVMSGALGWPLTVRVSRHTGFHWKTSQWSGKINMPSEPVPPELDYDLWLGPAPFKPYFRHRTHGSFRGYWDYDGGGLADMGQHYLDPVQYMLEKDETSPIRVDVDAPQQHYDAAGTWRRIEYTYADGCKIILDGENRDTEAAYISGPKGKLFRGFRSDIPNIEKIVASLPDPEPQVGTFSDSVRTRRKFALNEMNGHRSCTLVNLGILAVRLGRTLHFDPEAQRFRDDEAANRLIDQPMRAPWII